MDQKFSNFQKLNPRKENGSKMVLKPTWKKLGDLPTKMVGKWPIL